MNLVEYVCPRCRSALERHEARYLCEACNSVYPIIAGIPDFRVYPDPYIDLEADRAKGLHLDSQPLSFADLVRYYYSITPEVPPDLAQHYTTHHLAGVTRGHAILARLAHYGLDLGAHTLDLGCGTGGFLVAAAGQPLIGVDIAFRWLIVGRRRLREQGIDVPLVCACADYLPFPDHTFSLVVAEHVLEHIADAGRVMGAIKRVSLPDGAFLARTVNRFALAPEPHVGVWGVGFLPRSAMSKYVQRVKGIPYEHIYLRGEAGWRRLLRESQFTRFDVRYPYLQDIDYQHQSPLIRRLFGLYARMANSVPPLRPFLTQFGPYLDMVVR